MLEYAPQACGADAQLISELSEIQLRAEILLHPENGTADERASCDRYCVAPDYRLWRALVPHSIDQHLAQALEPPGLATMLHDEMYREVRRASTTGAGDAIAVNQEELIRHNRYVGELGDELGDMNPRDAACMPFHEPGSGKSKAPSA